MKVKAMGRSTEECAADAHNQSRLRRVLMRDCTSGRYIGFNAINS
jgi:hypothetical protein